MCAHGDADQPAGEHGVVPEHLVFTQLVDHAAVVDQLDHAAAHDPDVLGGLGGLQQDGAAGWVELDLAGVGDALQLGAFQRVERRGIREELCDFVHGVIFLRSNGQVQWRLDFEVCDC